MNQWKANFNERMCEFFNRREWLSTILSPIILIGFVSITIKDLMFEVFSRTVVGLFTISITLVCIGIFNSITVICGIRAKIKIQYIQGMSICSFVGANVAFELMKCFLQAIISSAIFIVIGNFAYETFPAEGLIFLLPLELFFIFVVTIFSADMLGMLISCWSKDTVTAMTLMPGFLVFEMVFSYALFPLPDFANNFLGKLTCLSLCKWSTSLLGIVCNLEQMETYIPSEAPAIVYTYSAENFWHCIQIVLLHAVVYVIITQARLSFIKTERIF